MATQTQDVHALIDARRAAALATWQELIRIPSISALREYDGETRRAAEFVAGTFRAAGLEHVAVIATAGAPLVYGDWLHAPGQPTVLVYAHYDVQPADPEALWTSPPFEPTVRGDQLYARGCSDDKLQAVATVQAAGALLAAHGALPVNMRFLFEGEEESGGEAIEAYVREHGAAIASDMVIVADGGMAAPGQPTAIYGCRGILYTEIVARGPQRDLHSGGYGGVAANPMFALAQIITGLKDDQGHITIPGLYELMDPISDDERALWAQIPLDHAAKFKEQIGGDTLTGETEYGLYERSVARPTLEVHGFVGGFQGEGSKTVIPAEGRAKVSLRLVPGQTPANVLPLLRARVAELTPPGIQTEVRLINGGLPFFTRTDSRVFRAARAALREEFGVVAWATRAGGSIPISSIFQDTLGAEVVVVGFGLSSDGAHSPNEHTSIPNFQRAIHGFARIYTALAQ